MEDKEKIELRKHCLNVVFEIYRNRKDFNTVDTLTTEANTLYQFLYSGYVPKTIKSESIVDNLKDYIEKNPYKSKQEQNLEELSVTIKVTD